MGNRSAKKRIVSLREIIQLHQRKIDIELSASSPDAPLIEHWRKEILNWQKQIEHTERQLTKHRRKKK